MIIKNETKIKNTLINWNNCKTWVFPNHGFQTELCTTPHPFHVHKCCIYSLFAKKKTPTTTTSVWGEKYNTWIPSDRERDREIERKHKCVQKIRSLFIYLSYFMYAVLALCYSNGWSIQNPREISTRA